MNQEQKDKVAGALGIPKAEQRILDSVGNHEYMCNCSACLQWWALVGPDGGGPGSYGPFTTEQVKKACIARGMTWPKCHQMSEECVITSRSK